MILEDLWKRQSFKCQPTLCTDCATETPCIGYIQPRLLVLLDLEICCSFLYTGKATASLDLNRNELSPNQAEPGSSVQFVPQMDLICLPGSNMRPRYSCRLRGPLVVGNIACQWLYYSDVATAAAAAISIHASHPTLSPRPCAVAQPRTAARTAAQPRSKSRCKPGPASACSREAA